MTNLSFTWHSQYGQNFWARGTNYILAGKWVVQTYWIWLRHESSLHCILRQYVLSLNATKLPKHISLQTFLVSRVILKQAVISLSLSYQKEAWLVPIKPCCRLVWHQLYNCEENSCYTKRLLGWAGASKAFFWYDNNEGLKTWFPMTRSMNLRTFLCIRCPPQCVGGFPWVYEVTSMTSCAGQMCLPAVNKSTPNGFPWNCWRSLSKLGNMKDKYI